MNALLVVDGVRFGGLENTRYGFPRSEYAWCCKIGEGGKRH